MPTTIQVQIVFSAFVLLAMIPCEIRSEPVLMWNGEFPKKTVFPKVPSDTFMEIITKLLENKMVVAFTANTLPMKQLREKGPAGESLFQYIKGTNPSLYVNVESPFKALNRSSAPKTTALLKVDGSTSSPVKCKTGTMALINLNPKRSRRQDEAIKAFAGSFNCEVVYLFTGKNKPPDELKVELGDEAEEEDEDVEEDVEFVGEGVLLTSDLFAMFIEKIFFKTGKGTKELVPTHLTVRGDSTKFTGQLTTNDGDLTIHMETVNGYCAIKSIQYKRITYRASYVEAPSDHSYYCGKLELTIGTNTLSFSKLQFQGTKHVDDIHKFKFREAWYCVQYFTPAILSGLFVMVLVISITMCGITWIMDVRTTDRFEDPGSPMLQINASD